MAVALDPALPTPAEAGSPIVHFEAVGEGLACLHGYDLDLANRIAQRHAEIVDGAWWSLGFWDGDGDHLGLLVHGPGGSVSVSFVDDGLRLTRPLLDRFADMAFRRLAVTAVLVRLPLSDRDRRATLHRMGFVFDELEQPIGRPAHVRLRLTPDSLPPRFRRWRTRRVH